MSKYGDLQSKYDHFSVPAYKIEVSRSELSGLIIDNICVDNSMGKTSGACRFSVHQAYEYGARRFCPSVLERLKPGGQISVSLGYGSCFGKVFTGYIDELGMRYNGEELCLNAVCLDARALMRDGACYHVAAGKSDDAMAGGILDKYSPLITEKSLMLPALGTGVNLTQPGSDLDYICGAAELRGKYFFIECGKAVIGDADNTVCVEFDWPDCEIELGARYLERKIIGAGYDYRDMQAFSDEKEIKANKQEALLTVIQNMQLPPHLLGDAGKSIVAAKINIAERQTVRGTVFCRGIPEPKMGQKVKINKFPFSSFSGCVFTVISIRHRMDVANGYSTEIGIEG